MTHETRPGFSDYIVFVDESGSPTLSPIDPNHPVFALVFCVFNKWTYCDLIQPAIKRLKFEFFGHDMVVLHSHAIRKRTGDFGILMNEERRIAFLARLDNLMRDMPFDIVTTVIDKRVVHGDGRGEIDYVYHHALRECIKKLHYFLGQRGQANNLTHIIAESRGKLEDRNLKAAFSKIPFALDFRSGEDPVRYHSEHFSLLFAEKKINSAGLQIADLLGHPIGRHAINPTQQNRAFDVIKGKIFGDLEPFFMP